MPTDTSQSGGLKGDFTERFRAQYRNWLDPPKEEKRETPEINHLSAGIKKKRDPKANDEEEDRVETNSELPGQIIHGFENEIKSLKNFLLDQKVNKEFKSLVIFGEYGVGKTALCKTIFNDDAVKSVYAPRIWVSMPSNDGEDKKISVVKRILKGLGAKVLLLENIHEEAVEEAAKNLERPPNNQRAGEIDRETAKEKELAALLYALHLNLRWKKYLIVFDDVREEDNWDEKLDLKLNEDEKWGKYLSDGFPKGSGGRVIYTSRDENLAKKLVAEEHEIHRLWPLTDTENVWKIYEAAVIENEEEPPRNDKKCKDELMNKSRGLPLAVRLLATLLPVFVDDEKNDQNGSTHGITEPANNSTTEGTGTSPPQQP